MQKDPIVIVSSARTPEGGAASLVNVTACKLDPRFRVSGTHIICTPLATRKKYVLKKGVASIYKGDGEVTAIAIEGII